MEDGELDGAVWRLKHVQQYPLPSDLSHNPSQGTCHGNKAVAVIAVRATLLSPAFVRLIRVITQWFEEGAASAVPPLLSSPGVSSACVAVRATASLRDAGGALVYEDEDDALPVPSEARIKRFFGSLSQ